MSDNEERDVHEVYRKEGVRLEEEMRPELYEFFYASDTMEYVEGIHAFDKAHTVMLTEQEIIPRDAGKQILEALQQLEEEGMVEIRKALGGHYHTGEAYLSETLGHDIAGRIHAGRSSGDLLAVSGRWRAREELLDTMQKLKTLRKALLEKAEKHTDTVIPGYTHMQHAQPTSFGHYLMSFEHALERSFEMLELSYKHTNVSPAGAAIMTGSSYNIDRKRTAELLGFEGISTNTMDAILNSDWGNEIHGALMALSMTITKLAEDITLFVTHEYDFLDLADRFCGTSSIMPQKKNPYLTEFTVGTAGEIYGNGVNALTGAKASHGRLDQMWAGFKGLTDSFELINDAVLVMMPEAIASLSVNKEEMKQAAGENWAQATDIADMMVREEDIPFRTAHQITGVLVRLATDRDISPQDITPDLIIEAAQEVTDNPLEVDDEALSNVLEPAECIHQRTLIGGPSPEQVQNDIERGFNALESDEENIRNQQERLETAAEDLEDAIDGIVE